MTDTTLNSFLARGHVGGVGFHYLCPLEYSTASGTTTWYGDNGAPTVSKNLFSAGIFC